MPIRALGLAASLALLAAAPPASAQPRLVESGMRVDKIKEGLYVVRGPFRLCGTRGCSRPGARDDGMLHEPGDVAVRVTPEGLILVDDKYPEDVPGLLAQVKTISDKPIRYMLNSHQHGDHVGGDGEIKKLGIEIVAQRNLRQGYAKADPAGAPNVTFGDSGSIFLGGVEVRMHHFAPAHTDGDTFVYFPDLKVVHTGDVVIDGMPIADLDAGGSWITYVDAIYELLKLDFDVAIPGHGDYLTKDQVRKYVQNLETMNARMADLVRKGTPKSELRTALKIDDLGWANSVSTVNFWTKAESYYDEIARSLAAEAKAPK
jgi:glyoxylase-like metal-dependent hydrolase (beta-lactamase superfamily II)